MYSLDLILTVFIIVTERDLFMQTYLQLSCLTIIRLQGKYII